VGTWSARRVVPRFAGVRSDTAGQLRLPGQRSVGSCDVEVITSVAQAGCRQGKRSVGKSEIARYSASRCPCTPHRLRESSIRVPPRVQHRSIRAVTVAPV
jgi:hypothetical protein